MISTPTSTKGLSLDTIVRGRDSLSDADTTYQVLHPYRSAPTGVSAIHSIETSSIDQYRTELSPSVGVATSRLTPHSAPRAVSITERGPRHEVQYEW